MSEAATIENDAALRDLVAKIVERADPVAVYLFGSRARGDHDEDSDYDVMIVVDDSWPPERANVREAFKLVEGRSVPVDALLVRRARFEEEKHLVGTMSHEVACDGRLLHGS